VERGRVRPRSKLIRGNRDVAAEFLNSWRNLGSWALADDRGGSARASLHEKIRDTVDFLDGSLLHIGKVAATTRAYAVCYK
jgi:hypothetical protein